MDDNRAQYSKDGSGAVSGISVNRQTLRYLT
jgi:hypothetical protein